MAKAKVQPVPAVLEAPALTTQKAANAAAEAANAARNAEIAAGARKPDAVEEVKRAQEEDGA